jgi:UDPglucose 6-dehydrogenase
VRIAVIGLGYVGLVTAACLARWGHSVSGVEADPFRLRRLRSGSLPFHEPGLSDLVADVAAQRRLSFRSLDELPAAVRKADIVIVAVGTHDGNGGWQTLTMTRTLAGVVPQLSGRTPLVIRSTLPPAYIASLPRTVREFREEVGLAGVPVLLNPEFTREGRAIDDFNAPDRVVLGIVDDPDGVGEAILRQVYCAAAAPVLVMPAIDAAFSKLASNLFLATKISFANELAGLCDAYGADVANVVTVMGHDPRIGSQFLQAGIGFGGSCLPHQVSMTVLASREVGLPAPLLSAVGEINSRQRTGFADRLLLLAGGGSGGVRICLLGLAFKPGTDDLRDAPALTIAADLLARGATVTAYDPMAAARGRAAQLVPGLLVAATAEEAMAGADAIGLVTEWPEFVHMDWAATRAIPRRPVVLDGRNALNAEALFDAGFTYEGFGRRAALRPAVDARGRMETPPTDPGTFLIAETVQTIVAPAHAAVAD